MANFKDWIHAAGIRALKTVAQTAVSVIGTCAVLDEVNWLVVASASALAGIVSLLTSLAGLPELKKNDTVVEEELAEAMSEAEEE